jgi:hypothetical protein
MIEIFNITHCVSKVTRAARRRLFSIISDITAVFGNLGRYPGKDAAGR